MGLYERFAVLDGVSFGFGAAKISQEYGVPPLNTYSCLRKLHAEKMIEGIVSDDETEPEFDLVLPELTGKGKIELLRLKKIGFKKKVTN